MVKSQRAYKFAAIISGLIAISTLPTEVSAKTRYSSKHTIKTVYKPKSFINTQVSTVLQTISDRPAQAVPVSGANELAIRTSGEKRDWLGQVYAKNLVEASPVTRLLSDKLVMARVLENYLKDKSGNYYPHTIGLKEFLEKYSLTDSKGQLIKDADKVETALADEFPKGFVVRPAVGIAPHESSLGLFPQSDAFIISLFREQSALYQPSHYLHPVRSHILEGVASGEALVLQDDIVREAELKSKLKHHSFAKVRIHTYEGKVVADSIPQRWVQDAVKVSAPQIQAIQEYVQGFLNNLPPTLLARQAWGVDVGVTDNGQLRIVDIITNRGLKGSWSSYLDQPRILGAYTRHFENYSKLEFSGLTGTLVRNNLGNYLPYWQMRIEKAQPGFNKVLAYLPPLP